MTANGRSAECVCRGHMKLRHLHAGPDNGVTAARLVQIVIRMAMHCHGRRLQTVRYDRPLPASDRLGTSNQESDVP